MKKFKKMQSVVCLMLAFVFLALNITGCGKNAGSGGISDNASGMGDTRQESSAEETQNDTSVKGRFLEKELPLPEGADIIYALQKFEDGSVGALAGNRKGTYSIYRSFDLGESWTETVFYDRESYLQACCLTEKGTAAGIFIREDGTEYLYYTDPEGQGKERKLDFQDNDLYIYEIVMTLRQELFVLAGQKLYQIDPEKGTYQILQAMDGEDIEFFQVIGDVLYLVGNRGAAVYDTADQTETASDVITQMLTANDYLTISGAGKPKVVFSTGCQEDGILLTCREGVFSYRRDGNVLEQLINGDTTSLRDPNFCLIGAAMPDQNHIMVAENFKLYLYSFDASAELSPARELRIYSLYESAFLEEAAVAYQMAHPDTIVNVEIGQSEGITPEDALKALNTDIYAGNGPDVLLLDGLPYEKYRERGLLADLTDVVEQVAKEDGIFENIAAPFYQNGQICCIPAGFGFMAGIENNGQAEIFKDPGDMRAYLEGLGEESMDIMPMSAECLLSLYYMAYTQVWMDEEHNIREEELGNILETCKRNLEKMNPGSESALDIRFGQSDIVEGVKLSTVMGMSAMENGKDAVEMGSFSGFPSFWIYYSIKKQVPSLELTILGEKEGGPNAYFPYQILSAVTGKNEESAKEFIALALGEEMNDSDGNGFPINRKALEKKCEDTTETQGVSMCSSDENGNIVELSLLPLTEAEKKDMLQKIESLDYACTLDRQIENLFIEQGIKYVRDEQSLENTVSAIQNKLNLYLSE